MGPERRKSNKLSSSFHKSWQAFSWILRKFEDKGEEKETEKWIYKRKGRFLVRIKLPKKLFN